MPGNGHVPFLEGGMVATPSCYSTTVPAVFIRLWQKLRKVDGAKYSFAQLRDICEGLHLFNNDGLINPDFIRQLAAFQMLRDHLGLKLGYRRLYSGSGMGDQGSSRRRKLWKAQPISITMSRIPETRRRQTSLRIRRRLTLLLTCSINTRRRAFPLFDAFCSSLSASPLGFLVVISIATPSNVKPRKPRSCSTRLPCGNG